MRHVIVICVAVASCLPASVRAAAFGGIVDLGTLGGARSFGLDINNNRGVSGNSNVTAAAVATFGEKGVAIDLNTLLPTGSGWVLTSAEGINAAGDITGYGMINGQAHAFVLAVPEPASVGVLGLMALRRRRAGQ